MNERPAQQSLFDDAIVVTDTGADAATIEATSEERADIITTDPVFLSDVPILGDDTVRPIEIRTRGVDGDMRTELRDGKILHRKGPHPTYVQVGNTVMERDKVRPAELARAKALMTDVVTTVIYNKGVVEQAHLDVFFAFAHLMYEHYTQTGIASGKVTATRPQICSIIGLHRSARAYKMIELALDSLTGLEVTKYFQPPETGPGVGILAQRVERLGNLLAGFKYDRTVSASGLGRHASAITVEINPLLVRAMCGQAESRHHVVRSLNLTQNMKHVQAWKRQLDRTLQQRLERGHFIMPLRELWISCLGGNAKDIDPAHPERWRKKRWQILRTMKEWETSGFLDNVRCYARRKTPDPKSHDATDPAEAESDATTTCAKRGITLTGVDGIGTFTVDLPGVDSTVGTEWIECDRGPEFYAGRPNSRLAFAKSILAATTESAAEIAQLLNEFSNDTIVTIGHRRLRSILTAMGDRMNRMQTSSWLARAYPQPVRSMFVTYCTDQVLHKHERLAKGEPASLPPASLADARSEFVLRRVAPLRKHDLEKVSQLKDVGPGLHEIASAYPIAMQRIIAQRGYDREILSEEARLLNKAHARDFETAYRIACDAAFLSGGTLHWFERIASIVAKKLPMKFGEALPQAYLIDAAKRWPDAMRIVREMLKGDKHEWERLVGMILQRRIVESVIEIEELEAMNEAAAER